MPDEASASTPDDPGSAQTVQPTQERSAPRTARRRRKATILVDLSLCKACGVCVSLCPVAVFDRDEAGQAVPVRAEECTVCRLCEWHCPDFAIEVLEEDDDTADRAATPSSAAAPPSGRTGGR